MGRAALVIWGLTLGLTAFAAEGPRTALVGGGDCQDPELVGYLRSFAERMRTQPRIRMVELSETAARLRRAPNASSEELKRRLEAAKADYYAVEFQRAEATLDAVIAEVAALPPGDARLSLQNSAWLWKMVVAIETRRPKDAEHAIRQVLRLQPQFVPDPVQFWPSIRKEVDQHRKRLAQAQDRSELEIKSSPSGAEVILDGVVVGQTPLRRPVLHGTYQLQVRKDAVSSFVRTVAVRAPTQVQLDLDFEGAVRTQPVPCLSGREDALMLSHAVRLGAVLEVDQLVVVSLARPGEGPPWLTATLIATDSAQKLREAGFQAKGDAQSEAALSDLAAYVTTGQPSKNVVVKTATGVPWSPPPVAVTERASPGFSFKPPGGALRRGLLFGGAGVAAAGFAGAGILRGLAQPEMEALEARLDDGRLVTGDTTGQELISSLQWKGNVTTGLLIAGGIGAVAAVGALLWPEAPVRPTVSLDQQGAWAVSVAGEF